MHTSQPIDTVPYNFVFCSETILFPQDNMFFSVSKNRASDMNPRLLTPQSVTLPTLYHELDGNHIFTPSKHSRSSMQLHLPSISSPFRHTPHPFPFIESISSLAGYFLFQFLVFLGKIFIPHSASACFSHHTSHALHSSTFT